MSDLFYYCFYFGSLSLYTSETGQMAGLLSDKIWETRALLHHETLWLRPQLQWRLERAHNSGTTFEFLSLFSPPAWPTDWAWLRCFTVITEWQVNITERSYKYYVLKLRSRDILRVKFSLCEETRELKKLMSGDIMWTKFNVHQVHVPNTNLEV